MTIMGKDCKVELLPAAAGGRSLMQSILWSGCAVFVGSERRRVLTVCLDMAYCGAKVKCSEEFCVLQNCFR